MRPWLRYLLVVVAVVVALYGAFSAFALSSSGTKVEAVVHVGSDAQGMYMRCDAAASTPGVCGGDRQMALTVHKRDRVHVTVTDDDGGGHGHDFNVEGWQYFAWPNSPETELNDETESVTFTTWATGAFHVLCELKGHDAAGMHGTLVVK